MHSPTETLQKSISRLPFTYSGEGYSVLHDSYSDFQVDQLLNPANILVALHAAADARTHAVSHRNFKVGGSMLAYNTSVARFQFLTGINVKPEEDSKTNIHAEQQALQTARDRGFTAIRLVVVVGETQNDQQSGHQMCTLHPCGLCRSVMNDSPMIDNDHTLVVTALPDLRTLEFSSINRLRRYHEAQEFDAVTRVDLPDLKLLKPLATGNVVRIVDTDENDEEEKVWTPLIFNAIQEFKRDNKESETEITL